MHLLMFNIQPTKKKKQMEGNQEGQHLRKSIISISKLAKNIHQTARMSLQIIIFYWKSPWIVKGQRFI